MAVREIAQIGDPILRQIAEPIDDPQASETIALLQDLRDTLLSFRAQTGYGRGIAAPQIGVSKRAVFIRMPDGREFAMVNPAITWLSHETFEVWDACFSYFWLFFKVRRARQVKATYQDTDGKWHELTASDDLAELLQHEFEHLDGQLAIDLVTDPHTFCSVAEYQKRYEGKSA
jgi:peptide deformylase